jgi:hypothetical protein
LNSENYSMSLPRIGGNFSFLVSLMKIARTAIRVEYEYTLGDHRGIDRKR